MLEQAPPRRLGQTTGLCPTCKRSLPAALWEVEGRIELRKACPDHGESGAVVAEDAAWYHATLAMAARATPPAEARAPSQGCPFDCGPCSQHQQRLFLPIVPITSACNLDCPICYTHNRNDGAWHLSEAELDSLLGHLRRAAPDRRIINLTGGEPTSHPDFLRIVERCAREGIHRITISTHGLRFLREPELLPRLAAVGARVILSFDSFEDTANKALLGGTFTAGKLRVLDLLEEHGIDTTLLPVLCRGVNDHELGRFITLALSRDHIRSVELHPMTFTGQSGAAFDRRARYTPDAVLRDIEAQTAGAVAVSDFVPSPAAHPLCYQVTYLLRLGDGRWLPFPRFMTRERLREMLGTSLYLEPGPGMERVLEDVINDLWTGEFPCEDEVAVLTALRGLAEAAFDPNRSPEQRLREAERRTRALYVHAHMDEESFDTDRIQLCPVSIREPDGQNIPSCAYNVIYRERDTRFQVHPKAPVSTLGPGRMPAAD